MGNRASKHLLECRCPLSTDVVVLQKETLPELAKEAGYKSPEYAKMVEFGGRIIKKQETRHRKAKQLLEPEPDESGLLTGEERIAIWNEYKAEHPDPELVAITDFPYVNNLLKSQLAKDKEHEQARVERIFQEADPHLGVVPWWQALKKQEGIK